MTADRQKRNTLLFLGFFLLAGCVSLFNRTHIPEVDKLVTCLNDVIFVGLLLFWLQSVRERLLPSREKEYVLGAAGFLLFYILVRIIKYRFITDPVGIRYGIYLYGIPKIFVPALFLMTCICTRNREKGKSKRKEILLLVPAAVLALMVVTNDLHSFCYIPPTCSIYQVPSVKDYSHGPGFYLLYVWMIGTALAGFWILFRETGHRYKKAIRYLILLISLWVLSLSVTVLIFDRLAKPVTFIKVPETHVFGMLAVFEICIRFHLIPSNENYTGFFRALRLPVLITDRAFHPVYRTKNELPAEETEQRAALTEPVLKGNYKLSAILIHAGYAFWAEDETEIHKAWDRLMEANELIEQENDLIRAETKQREKEAYLQSRHRIYHEIAAELYPCQKRIGRLLEQAVPGREDFKGKIAQICVLNAYVKRKTNLLLLSAEKERISLAELSLSLQESANYLTLAGLHTTASVPETGELPSEQVLLLYDAFEAIAEQLPGKASSLMISWYGNGLRLAAETEDIPKTEEIALPVIFLKSEDILYMDIPAGTEGAAA